MGKPQHIWSHFYRIHVWSYEKDVLHTSNSSFQKLVIDFSASKTTVKESRVLEIKHSIEFACSFFCFFVSFM